MNYVDIKIKYLLEEMLSREMKWYEVVIIYTAIHIELRWFCKSLNNGAIHREGTKAKCVDLGLSYSLLAESLTFDDLLPSCFNENDAVLLNSFSHE